MSSTTQVHPLAALGGPGQVNANVSTAQIFPSAQTPTLAYTLNAQGSGKLEQKRFYVRASGYVTGGTTTNVTVTLYAVAGPNIPANPLTAGSWTVLGASTARAVNSSTAPWFYEAALVFDSVSGKLHGTFTDVINNNLDAAAALSNVVTGINGSTSASLGVEPPIIFVVGITFSAANAGNIGNLGDFTLDY